MRTLSLQFLVFWRLPVAPEIHGHSPLYPAVSLLPGVGVLQQLQPVQVFPAGGEHGDRGVLLGRSLPAAAAPGPLSVGEGSDAAQPLPAGEAQVSLNYVTQSAPRAQRSRKLSSGALSSLGSTRTLCFKCF